MMKTNRQHHNILLLMAVAMMAMLGSSCTHNGGDIGAWFGIWHLDQVSCDSASNLLDSTDYYFNFQDHIVSVRIEGPEHYQDETFGNWQESGDQLVITFPDPDRHWPPIPGFSAECKFTFVQRSSKRMVLRLVAYDGHTYTYTLRKTV